MEQKSGILIVDDDVDLASSQQDILEAKGYSTAIARDGQTALALCKEKSFSLAIIDLKLPDIPGVKLIQKLAKASPEMEYIISTGYASLETAVEAIGEKRVIAYETKPINMDHLLAFITQVTERKQAEEALQQSEENFRLLAENSNDGIAISYVFGKDTGELVYVNSRFQELTGYTEKELLSLPILTIIHPSERDRIAGIRKKRLDGEPAPRHYETILLTKDGRSIPVEVTVGSTVWHSESAVMVVYRNITERKQADELFRSVTSSSPLGICITQDNKFQFVNPEFMKLTGYGQNDLLGRDSYDLVAPEDRSIARENAIKMLSGQSTEPYEYRCLDSKGNIRWILETVAPISYGGGRAIHSSFMDITERKKAEEALRESEEKYRSIFDKAPISLILLDKDGQMVEVNPYHVTHIGRSKAPLEDYLGKNIITFPPVIDAGLSDTYARLLNGEPFSLESVYFPTTTGGTDRYLNVRGIPLFKEGNVIGAISIQEDITERKRVEEQIQALYQQEKALRQELEAEIKKRIEFSRALVHELKTPLTPIVASSDLLVDYLKEQPAHDIARNIYRGAQNLSKRIDELLDLSRAELGMIKLNLKSVDLNEMLRRIADEMTPMIIEQNKSLGLELPFPLPSVTADGERLEQVVMNLLTNANKFTDERGKITLRAKQEGDMVTVSVSDNGPGINKKIRERLFDPYYRDESDRQRLSGLGLGLALCKTLVELHGGRIWVETATGKGSTFSFSIPLDSTHYKPQAAETGGKP